MDPRQPLLSSYSYPMKIFSFLSGGGGDQALLVAWAGQSLLMSDRKKASVNKLNRGGDE